MVFEVTLRNAQRLKQISKTKAERGKGWNRTLPKRLEKDPFRFRFKEGRRRKKRKGEEGLERPNGNEP